MHRIRSRLGVVWLLAAAVLAAPAAAQEQSVRQPIRQACAADVRRLCADVTRGHGQIRRCMIAKHDQLSNDCRAALSAARAMKAP
jgi:hypothetical protein